MLSAELLRPSALGVAELAAWRGMIAATPGLRRAFLSPGFAQACESAHGRARVAVLHEGGAIRGFLAFQFASSWHRSMGLAERIGGELCDAAGLVAVPGVMIEPAALLRLCRLGRMFATHLVPGQAAFGLAAETTEPGHLIDLAAGRAAYLATLRPDLVRDTTRRLRRAERDHGPLHFTFDPRPDAVAALRVIAHKRAQYRRTGAADPFAVPHRLRLIEALCDAPTPACQPVLASLSAGERVLAQHLGLLCGGVLSYWFPVYDPAAEKISPGRLLLWRQIEAAASCGVTLIDRGAGDNDAKRDFSNRTQALGLANWSAGGARALAAKLLQAALWRVGR
jgi:CelD/BcsL family acetyltransferase involved in cellulose biosynthesis